MLENVSMQFESTSFVAGLGTQSLKRNRQELLLAELSVIHHIKGLKLLVFVDRANEKLLFFFKVRVEIELYFW